MTRHEELYTRVLIYQKIKDREKKKTQRTLSEQSMMLNLLIEIFGARATFAKKATSSLFETMEERSINKTIRKVRVNKKKEKKYDEVR